MADLERQGACSAMSSRLPVRGLRLLSLACLLCLPPALASEAGDALASVDPMAHLKARLQEKLGETRLREAAPGSHELKVTARAPAPAPRPARPAPDLEAAVAAHRASQPGADGHAPHWAYGGEVGPARWGALRPEFALCAKGARQSPIDIRDGIAVDLEPPLFDYRPTGFAVVDNGHTVQVNLGPGNTVQVMGRRYELQQFHFHRPSEERINGRLFELSVHLVHRDPEGRLAVVAVVLERGAAQAVVQQVWNNLPLEKHEPLAASDAIDPAGLLPPDLRYFTYMGSLTTPPCTEGVLWMVMQQPVPVSQAQIDIFARLYPMNARPVQQASGRLIKQSR
jgi:carbonic anhydrase